MGTLNTRTIVVATICAILALTLLYNQRSGNQARIREVQKVSETHCVTINQVKTALVEYIEQQINRSMRSLPTIEYYQNHPVELGRALANLAEQREQTREAFKPTDC